jgi:hypothetical protein
MLKYVMGVIAIGVVLWGSSPNALGQKATEMFIPLGQSPGLSSKYTVIGTIETVDARNRTIIITGPSETWSAQITDQTKIWLDRSKLRLTNQKGTFADLRKGRLVEVKYEDANRKGKSPAGWIKVQVTSPGA